MGSNFLEEVSSMVGADVCIETADGVYLRGKLTGLNFSWIKLPRGKVSFPTSICLDNESEKTIEIVRVVEIKQF